MWMAALVRFNFSSPENSVRTSPPAGTLAAFFV
jgi:hypothetical protein